MAVHSPIESVVYKECMQYLQIPLDGRAEDSLYMSVSTQHLLRYHELGNRFLSRTIAADETWCYHFELDTKGLSLEWRHPFFPRTKKAQTSTRAGKAC
ncbi:hypothetical protein TNCV_4578211 [Trichonephila clavipes]|nr:hypothetical protein TNCV_4578211 [Trichonephila clavipes]